VRFSSDQISLLSGVAKMLRKMAESVTVAMLDLHPSCIELVQLENETFNVDMREQQFNTIVIREKAGLHLRDVPKLGLHLTQETETGARPLSTIIHQRYLYDIQQH
jgi:hypothetical protein